VAVGVARENSRHGRWYIVPFISVYFSVDAGDSWENSTADRAFLLSIVPSLSLMLPSLPLPCCDIVISLLLNPPTLCHRCIKRQWRGNASVVLATNCFV